MALRQQYTENLKFAQMFNISLTTNYTVSPHHSGIYPINPEAYKVWTELLSVQATSTEIYPYTSPVYARRGFIYNNIMVAPRQTTLTFTTTIFFHSGNKNAQYWISIYEGGQLFETILYTQVSIFMTHLGNFGNDRLAVFLFRNVFLFLSCWTNFQFFSLPHLEMVKKHFELNPEDTEPLWNVN